MTSEASESSALIAPSHVRRRFLGWQIVAVAFVAQLVSTGAILAAFGNFIAPISEEFGVSPSLIGIGPGLAIAAIGILGPLIGRALDRGWTRPLMLVGATMTGGGLILLSETTSLWQLTLIYVGLVCTGGALFGTLPSITLVANWFVRRRGLMLGVAVAGATVASAAAPLFAQAVMDADGWRVAARYMGLLAWVATLPIFAAFIVARPEDVGQRPDGDPAPELEPLGTTQSGPAEPSTPSIPSPHEAPAAAEGMDDSAAPLPGLRTAQDLARDPLLWRVAVGFGLIMTSPVVIIGLIVPFGLSLGFTGVQASAFYLAMAPFSIAGKVVIGGLADVAPLKPSLAMTVLVNVMVWILLYSDPSYPVFIATGALYGIGIGGAAPLHGVLNGRLFGRANFGTVGGLGGLAAIPLIVMAQILSQILLATTGSFHVSFIVQGGLLLLGGLMLATIRIPSHDAAPASA